MIRNFIPFQEAEESQGLWGCEAGKLDGLPGPGERGGAGGTARASTPPFTPMSAVG